VNNLSKLVTRERNGGASDQRHFESQVQRSNHYINRFAPFSRLKKIDRTDNPVRRPKSRTVFLLSQISDRMRDWQTVNGLGFTRANRTVK